MSTWSYIPTLIREVLGPRVLERVPEPALLMTDGDQVDAYADAARDGLGAMAATYVFHAAHIAQAVAGAARVVDLACGPGTLLAMVAQLLPDTQFVGVDLSAPMLATARAHMRARGVDNVALVHGDITTLASIPDDHADGVVSSMALHHLPDVDALRACFRTMDRVAKPGAGVLVIDFARLKSHRSVNRFVADVRGRHAARFVEDYDLSLRAAFRARDMRAAAAALTCAPVRVRTTFGIPLMVVVKTADRPLPAAAAARVRAWRDELAERDRVDLDDLRRFFRLGRLGSDPFASP